MLRITCLENGSKIRLKLEGRLVGPWVEELRQRVLQLRPIDATLEVEITDLIFVDHDGEYVLLWLSTLGAEFRGSGTYGRFLCESLEIPVVVI